jgi:hypothetical protein
MGLVITAKGKPIATLILDLQCDMPRCTQGTKFVSLGGNVGDGGFIHLYRIAMGVGWLERFSNRPPEQRLFLCPNCSGKEAKEGNKPAPVLVTGGVGL